MNKKTFAQWLIGHRARIDAALNAYLSALRDRKSARLIDRRLSALMTVIDETDQLGASPRIALK